MRKFTLAWIIWAALFVGIETAALVNIAPGGTLSEHIWALTKPTSGKWNFARVLLVAVMGWMTGHLIFGWWGLKLRKRGWISR